jgi:hypothetical protein
MLVCPEIYTPRSYTFALCCLGLFSKREPELFRRRYARTAILDKRICTSVYLYTLPLYLALGVSHRHILWELYRLGVGFLCDSPHTGFRELFFSAIG